MTHNTRRANGGGKPNRKQYSLLTPDQFVDSAVALDALGWHPIPLGGPTGKTPLISGVTGYLGVDVHDEDTFRDWADSYADAGLNLGVRMPVGVIALDVDGYDGKPGLETLAAREAEWGALPATWSVTSRDDGSRKMFFRVPDDWKSAGMLTAGEYSKQSGVEVLQRHHRQAVVSPSIHHTGRAVRTLDPNGDRVKQLPRPECLPMLPGAWLDGLRKDRQERHQRGSEAEAHAILEGLVDGPMAPAVQRLVNEMLGALTGEGSRYDTMNSVVIRLVRRGVQHHDVGVPTALRLVQAEYVRVVGPERGGEPVAEREFAKAKHDAGAILAGEPPPDPRMTAAFAPGGAWHRDTGWMPDPEDAQYMIRGVTSSAGDAEAHVLVSSWCPADVTAALTGEGPPPPAVLSRDDDACLFYPGKVHSVHGESESGKSWVVQCAAAQQLLGVGSVLYVDFEDDVAGVANRLALLGVPRAVLADPARFVYVHPEESLSGDPAQEAFKALVSRPFTFAVIDGVTDAMGVFGYSLKDNDDIAAWQRELPRAVAGRTGAAVACVDHVTKDADTRGRFSIGGQHKIAGLDGAAFVVEVERPFGVGMAGAASIRVGKDRPGHVRKMGVGWRKGDRTQRVGTFHLDSTTPDLLTWKLAAPNDVAPEAKAKAKATAASGDPFRPTWFMEQVSRYWEETADPSDRTQNKTVTAMCAERKALGKKENRQKWRDAIDLLVAEEFAVVETGPRNANCHRVLTPYRQVQDPQADGNNGGRTFTFSVDSGRDGSTFDRADHAGTVP